MYEEILCQISIELRVKFFNLISKDDETKSNCIPFSGDGIHGPIFKMAWMTFC